MEIKAKYPFQTNWVENITYLTYILVNMRDYKIVLIPVMGWKNKQKSF